MRLGTGTPEMCATFMQFAIGQGRCNISMKAPDRNTYEAIIETTSVNEAERIDAALFNGFKMAWQERGRSIAPRATGAWPHVD